MDDIEKAIHLLLNGKRRIKVISNGPYWDHKEDYDGHRALIRCNGGVNIAIAGMKPPERECDEFYIALEIVNKVDNILGKP